MSVFTVLENLKVPLQYSSCCGLARSPPMPQLGKECEAKPSQRHYHVMHKHLLGLVLLILL